MLWAVPLEIYATVGMFDFTQVTEVWEKTEYRELQMVSCDSNYFLCFLLVDVDPPLVELPVHGMVLVTDLC